MAITMSEATVDDSQRQTLLNSTIDTSVTNGGETANRGGLFGLGNPSGSAIAGITPTFTANLHTSIDSYSEEIISILEKLEAVESNIAFQGTELKNALTTFINSVRNISINYTSRLKEAEKQIISEVEKVYTQQDVDISGNLGTDSATLEDSNTTNSSTY